MMEYLNIIWATGLATPTAPAPLFYPTPNPQAGGPTLVGSPQLLIQYISRYSSYLEAISSVRNLRVHHALVTRDPLNMFSYEFFYWIIPQIV
jgi:hypothetical protein